MADVFSKSKRSEVMSKIKGKDTIFEIRTRKWLFSRGYRFRKNDKHLPGKPDIVLPKFKTVIFIHGCFWHGHTDCKYFRLPKSNREFWEQKISGNIERDKEVVASLESIKWNVIVLWECQLKSSFDQSMIRLDSELYMS